MEKLKLVLRVLLSLCITMALLSGCGPTTSEERGPQEGVQDESAEPNTNASVEEPAEDPTDKINKYLLVAGMSCARKTIQAVSDCEDKLPQQAKAVLHTLKENDKFTAILIPFQVDDINTKLHLNISGFYEYLPEYFDAQLLYDWFYVRYVDMDISDNMEEKQQFESAGDWLAIAAPNGDCESWVLPIFCGDISDPEAGILVTFDPVGDNIIAVGARCFGREIAQYLTNNCQEWLDQGTQYMQRDIINIENKFNTDFLSVPFAGALDINSFLIETATLMNNLYRDDLISAGIEKYVDQSDRYSYANIQELAESTSRFDIGIVLPYGTGTYYANNYPIDIGELVLLGNNTFRLFPLPTNWNEDVSVVLGSQDAQCYAKVSFRAGFGEYDDNVLCVSYSCIPIVGADKFMRGFAKDKVPYDSPYGDWTEYAGIQNIKYVEPEIDPNDYYDYPLCSGGGYSIVAKQVETVTDSWVEIGVLNDSYDWIIDMAADTPLHSNGRLPDPNGYIHFASICNQMDDYIHYSGNGIFIYARPKMTLNGHDFYEVTSWNILENTSYEFSRLITKTFTLQNGYIIMMDDSYFDSHSGNVLIMNDKGEFIQTDIYCGSTTYLGQYAEGVFFSYDGFYDIDGKLVIDLSEYAGLINNNPTFVNGQCKLTAVNPNGVEFNAVLNIDGTFVSEFTRTD